MFMSQAETMLGRVARATKATGEMGNFIFILDEEDEGVNEHLEYYKRYISIARVLSSMLT